MFLKGNAPDSELPEAIFGAVTRIAICQTLLSLQVSLFIDNPKSSEILKGGRKFFMYATI